MNRKDTSLETSSSPLLRRQVFDSPGAADWLRVTSAKVPSGAWLLLPSLLAVAALVLVLGHIEHTQMRWQTASLQIDASTCDGAAGCAPVPWIDVPRGGRPGWLVIALPAAEGQGSRRRLEVTQWSTPGDARMQRAMLAWPADLPVPSGPLRVSLPQRHSLLGWMLPAWRRFETHRS